MSHISVLLFETVESLLADRTTGVYIDATFGRGGHTRLLLSKLDENARVYAFDKDPQALEVAAALHKKTQDLPLFMQVLLKLKKKCRKLGCKALMGLWLT
jgi:Predicted S-adenosylmethionine-dependent methyltransferase involved in cell envelope biogenesis